MRQSLLDELISKIEGMSPEERAQAEEMVLQGVGDMVWTPQPGPQTDAYFSEADELYYGGEAGGGKGQALDAPILTPFGWRKMGDLEIGSLISNPEGTARVIGIYPLGIRQLYTVKFHDGTSAEVTDDHIWLAWRSRRGESASRLWTTKDMMEKIRRGWRFTIPVTQAISFTDSARGERRPVDPYLLGVLLGDGSLTEKCLRISSADPEIIGRIKQPILGPYKYDGKVAEYRLREPNNVRKHLRKWGLIGCGSAEKFIPPAYLMGSVEGRFELLRGLMDTDGWADKDGDIYYCTISQRLRDDVASLARSLGAVVFIRSKFAKCQNGNGSEAYTLRIKMRNPEEAFHLERKKVKCRGRVPQSMGKNIVSISPSRQEIAQCIKVDHPNSLYITTDYTVTHNTDLIIGLSLTAHTDSLLLRRVNKDARSLMDRVEQVLGHTEGRNLSLWEWKRGDGKVEFGGCEHEKDKERRKGIPHDLKAFDEIGDFSEGQFRFIKTWNRSSKPGQRSRIVCTGNPPTNPEGLWVIEYWAPWLDPRHPNPAKSGELRWFISDENGKDKEVPGPGEYALFNDDGAPRLKSDGTPDKVLARSRTFIRARLADNQYYGEEYAAVLDALPAELRAAYRDGRFDQSLKDSPTQTIPTSWVMAAIERRRAHPQRPQGVPMCAIGVDPAGGGKDEYVMSPRYDGWYADIVGIPAKVVPMGSDMAAQIVKIRRDNALPIVDMGGGYGGGVIQTLGENNIPYAIHKGSEKSTGRDKSGKLKFRNKRSEIIWRFREALDPDQEGGSQIMLPDDPRMIADLTAPTFRVGPQGIEVESKEDVCERLGRSTDRGDAVVMAWSGGIKGENIQGGWASHSRNQTPQVSMGYSAVRRKR